MSEATELTPATVKRLTALVTSAEGVATMAKDQADTALFTAYVEAAGIADAELDGIASRKLAAASGMRATAAARSLYAFRGLATHSSFSLGSASELFAGAFRLATRRGSKWADALGAALDGVPVKNRAAAVARVAKWIDAEIAADKAAARKAAAEKTAAAEKGRAVEAGAVAEASAPVTSDKAASRQADAVASFGRIIADVIAGHVVFTADMAAALDALNGYLAPAPVPSAGKAKVAA